MGLDKRGGSGYNLRVLEGLNFLSVRRVRQGVELWHTLIPIV